jgi:predicted O-methyltransferase YrrM
MDDRLTRFLDDLYRRNADEDATRSDRLARWRTVEPDTARLMAVLVRARAPRTLLELGTSSGYSTIWLADAAREVGGQLTSVDVDPERTAVARANLAAAGLESGVELRTADAGAVLAESADRSWEFVFLDAERPQYAGYWPDLRRSIAPRGLLVVDNVLSHAEQVAEMRALVDADSTVTQALAPTGAGALLVITGDQTVS